MTKEIETEEEAVKIYKEAVEAIKDKDVKNFTKTLVDRNYEFITIKDEMISFQTKNVVFCDNRKKSNKKIEITILFYINLKDESIEKRIIVDFGDNPDDGWDNSDFLSEEEIGNVKETLEIIQEELTQDVWYILKIMSKEKLTKMSLNDKRELVKQRIINTLLKIEHEYAEYERLNFFFVDAMNEQVIELVEELDDETINKFIMMPTEKLKPIVEEMFDDTKDFVCAIFTKVAEKRIQEETQ